MKLHGGVEDPPGTAQVATTPETATFLDRVPVKEPPATVATEHGVKAERDVDGFRAAGATRTPRSPSAHPVGIVRASYVAGMQTSFSSGGELPHVRANRALAEIQLSVEQSNALFTATAPTAQFLGDLRTALKPLTGVSFELAGVAFQTNSVGGRATTVIKKGSLEGFVEREISDDGKTLILHGSYLRYLGPKKDQRIPSGIQAGGDPGYTIPTLLLVNALQLNALENHLGHPLAQSVIFAETMLTNTKTCLEMGVAMAESGTSMNDAYETTSTARYLRQLFASAGLDIDSTNVRGAECALEDLLCEDHQKSDPRVMRLVEKLGAGCRVPADVAVDFRLAPAQA